jgi:membrane protein implicated in regulation of membrane protease activity
VKINKDSWHYKLWRKSFTFGERVPEDTDLCRYCHKVFWQLVAYAALASMVVVLIGLVIALLVMIGRAAWLHAGLALEITLGSAAAIAAVVFYVRWLNRGRSYREPKTLVGKYAAATKQRVCPLVEFTTDEE